MPGSATGSDDFGEFQYELFDLARDPAEAADLASREPERVARMSAALQSWQGSVLRSLNGEGDAP